MRTTLTVAAAVTGILLAGGAAQAAATLPNTGDGSLLFFETDTVTNQTYTDVLSQDVNSYFTTAQATSGTNGIVTAINGDANFSVDLSTDTTLSSFLATAGSDALSYGVIAGAYSGPLGAGQRPAGKVRVIATSANLTSVLQNTQSQIVNAIPSGILNDTNSLNLNLGATANSTNQGVFGTSVSTAGTTLDLYSGGLDQSGVAPGTSVTLYGVTGNGTGSGATTAFDLGTVLFNESNDKLTFTGNGGTAPVPLPAAIWLLGSGLLGLAGVGRRRALKTA